MNDSRSQVFNGMDMDIDSFDPGGQFGQPKAFFDPGGKIVALQFRLQSRFYEMVIQGISADRRKDVPKRIEVIGELIGEIDESLNIVEKKGIVGFLVERGGLQRAVALDNVHQSLPETLHRRILPEIHGHDLFGERMFTKAPQYPNRKVAVIGGSNLPKFVERRKGVVEDGGFRACPDQVKEFGKGIRPFSGQHLQRSAGTKLQHISHDYPLFK